MQENRRNRRRILGAKNKNYQEVVTNLEEVKIEEEQEQVLEPVTESTEDFSFVRDEDTRGGKSKKSSHDDGCGCHKHKDDCHKHHDHCDCEPCGISDGNAQCSKNVCADECGLAYQPARFSTSNAVPYAVEVNRVFDTMLIQALAEVEEPIDGDDIEVVMVSGPGPRFGEASVKIEDVCIRYDSIEIIPGTDPEPDGIFLDDYEICQPADGDCEVFDYQVAGKVDDDCNDRHDRHDCDDKHNQNLSGNRNVAQSGRSASYKQRGLTIRVNGLSVELSGKCGCTEFTAITDESDREFRFNTIGGAVVVPADGRSFTLRQEFQTALKVDCIGRAVLYCDCDSKGRPRYGLCVPSGIDVICCLQQLVSILVNEQIVVLGSNTPVRPRVADAFSNVCNFKSSNNGNSKGNDNNGCGCFRD